MVHVIAEGIGYSEDKRVGCACLLLDGWHRSFHIHHGVESETEIVNLLYLLQDCGYGEASEGLVWCGYMDKMWNDAGQRV